MTTDPGERPHDHQAGRRIPKCHTVDWFQTTLLHSARRLCIYLTNARDVSTVTASACNTWYAGRQPTHFSQNGPRNRAQIGNVGYDRFCNNQRNIVQWFAQGNVRFNRSTSLKAIQYDYIEWTAGLPINMRVLRKRCVFSRSFAPRTGNMGYNLQGKGSYIWQYGYGHHFGGGFGHFPPIIFPVAGVSIFGNGRIYDIWYITLFILEPLHKSTVCLVISYNLYRSTENL